MFHALPVSGQLQVSSRSTEGRQADQCDDSAERACKPTEHAVLDDDGDRSPTPWQWISH
jgi:hypothetical protein